MVRPRFEGDTGFMTTRKPELIGIDPDQMETVRQVAEWTGRSEEEVIAAALIAYLDEQVMAVANQEIRAVRAERRARPQRTRAAS